MKNYKNDNLIQAITMQAALMANVFCKKCFKEITNRTYFRFLNYSLVEKSET